MDDASHPMMSEDWYCTACGERKGALGGSAWRMAGDHWQHRCDGLHPQVGHYQAIRIPQIPTVRDEEARLLFITKQHHETLAQVDLALKAGVYHFTSDDVLILMDIIDRLQAQTEAARTLLVRTQTAITHWPTCSIWTEGQGSCDCGALSASNLLKYILDMMEVQDD